MNICETERLILRPLQKDDSAFIFRLVNEPSFIENIGDKGVRNLDDAWQYILQGPRKSYEQNGFGLWLVALKDTLTPIGICGLVKRDGLDDPDIGYAFLPEFWKQGYAVEAAAQTLIFVTHIESEFPMCVTHRLQLNAGSAIERRSARGLHKKIAAAAVPLLIWVCMCWIWHCG